MPQAPKELAMKWGGEAGIGEDKAMAHLERNFALTRGWEWVPTAGYTPTEEDYEAASFLVLEWDFGGIVYKK